ncbi:MAG: hypothetical protein MJ175_03375, partial [Clostridia bacterium]|nr:hypothetical protein [Clostridia bacterium]
MKKITAGLCLAALVLSMLSCGETAETPDPQIGNNDNTGTTAANTPEEDERAPYAAIAPAVEDFGGYTYRMASQDNVKGKYPLFTADTQSGDTINDAIYQRNSAVADAYNINIAFVELEDTN